jgi:hypothetical protein
MNKAPSPHEFLLKGGMAFCVFVIVAFAQASTRESVREELIRLQQQTGISLVSFGGGGGSGHINVVMMASRHFEDRQLLKGENVGEGVVSRDGSAIAFELRRKTGRTFSTPSAKEVPEIGSRLGIVRHDGSDLKEYSDLADPYSPCWSFDKSALALTVKNLKQGEDAKTSLQILNLSEGTTEDVEANGYATSQCWSPNGRQIVPSTPRSPDLRRTREEIRSPCGRHRPHVVARWELDRISRRREVLRHPTIRQRKEGALQMQGCAHAVVVVT